MLSKILIVSLATLMLSACVTETTTEDITTVIVEESTQATPLAESTQFGIEVIEVEETTEPTEITEPVVLTNLGKFKLTAYCACKKCCGKSDGITATGAVATAGRTIAVDPRKIPYGTEVIINGNTYVAEDCGGAIKGKKIDIYFDTHQEALEFGVKYAEVSIVGS